MRFTRTKALVVTVGLALSLAACGDAGDDTEGADVEVAESAADDFEDGTRMKELAEARLVELDADRDLVLAAAARGLVVPVVAAAGGGGQGEGEDGGRGGGDLAELHGAHPFDW